jgi:hypothetical protein
VEPVRRLRRSTALAVGFVALAGVSAGAVVAGQIVDFDDPVSIDLALEEAPLTEVADLPSAAGTVARSMFVQRAGGLACIWDAPNATSRMRQGGCNLESDPLGDSELFVSYAFDGGPKISDITDARLIGLASAQVVRVEIALSDGSTRSATLHPANAAGSGLQAFAHRVARRDLRRGIGPVAVRAFDATGIRVANETGFAG